MPPSIAPGSARPALPRPHEPQRFRDAFLPRALAALALSMLSAGTLAQSLTGKPEGLSAQTSSDAPVLQSDPRKISTVAEQAGRLLREGKPGDASGLLDSALRDHPGNPQLRFLYGVAQSDLGRRTDAIDVFQQLATDFPELPEPHNNLAVLYAASGELDKARAALEEAARAAPGYALAQENLGDLHLRLAARAYERALEIDRRSESARDKLGLARDLISRIGGPVTPTGAGQPVPAPVAPLKPPEPRSAVEGTGAGGKESAARGVDSGGSDASSGSNCASEGGVKPLKPSLSSASPTRTVARKSPARGK